MNFDQVFGSRLSDFGHKICFEGPRKDGEFVLYWCHLAQRTAGNHALTAACRIANAMKKPLVALLAVGWEKHRLTARQIEFIGGGLADLHSNLSNIGACSVLRVGDLDVADDLIGRAAAVVTDFGYLKHHKEQRRRLAENAGRAAYALETNVCFPVEMVSDKAEYAARTIRPKLHDLLEAGIYIPSDEEVTASVSTADFNGLKWKKEALLEGLKAKGDLVDDAPRGGEAHAKKKLESFLRSELADYDEQRSRPENSAVSGLSPYLRFGMIAPGEVVQKAQSAKANSDGFIEEVLVRRELSANFCHYNKNYDTLDSLPDWARETLHDHKADEKPTILSRDQLETSESPDDVWNAAMAAMRNTGYLHNHLRMYWAKQVLHWTQDPENAFKVLLDLNNRYFLDGGDPNSFANVAWAFGLHDRPFGESDVFGKVRPMSRSGLERKMNVDEVIATIGE